MTDSAYILENSAGGYKIVVESLFTRFGTHNTDNAVLNAQCRIEYKPTVAKYTGMTVMFDNGKEFTIKQGAGALYQVTDGSGDPPSAHDIEGRAYTIYSQLEITAAQGEKVMAGEKVTITIPKSAGISAPADLTKAVVATQADKEKCTHNIVPVDTENHGVTLETASNDLNTADTMTVTRRCNYAGRIPDKDMSIAAKSTIRRVFASALGRSTSNVLASTAKLSQVGPFQYDASESGPHLLGKPLNVYGATSLIATTSLSHDELKPGVTLSTPLDTITRTDWEREKTFAGKAFVIGQEESGMAAPLDISAIQRVIAVADATQIEVGDYLNVGDEMMYVESVDGNYIGVQRGAVGTMASSHKSLGHASQDDKAKQYMGRFEASEGGGANTATSIDRVPATGWVTIWKRDTSVSSYYLVEASTASKLSAVSDLTLNAVPSDLRTHTEGCILLVGGTSSKEFMAGAGHVNNKLRVLAGAATSVASGMLPFVAENQYAHQIGDSVVQYTCAWSMATQMSSTPSETMAGVSQRDNRCKQTTLLGLPIIPVASSAGIKPGDYVRVDFPSQSANWSPGKEVKDYDEELYRVNAVHDNDLIVTHKPLAWAGFGSNVNRYAGGTNLDLLTYKTTITYVTAAAGIPGAAAHDWKPIIATFSAVNDVHIGYYCLIDREFMYISSIVGNTVTFAAKGTPAAGRVCGNQGRGAFGTGAVIHSPTGSCHVYEYKGGSGQGTEPKRRGFGFTTIYDPRVSIRQIKTVASSTSLLLQAKADTTQKTGSEPSNVIGDPFEQYQNEQPVRSGTDYRCPFVGAKATGFNDVDNNSPQSASIKLSEATSATDTVFKIKVNNQALNTGWSLDLVVGDYVLVGLGLPSAYMRVTGIDTALSQITVDRTMDFMPSTNGACLTGATHKALQVGDEFYYVHHNCPTFSVVLDVAKAKFDFAVANTATTVAVSDASVFTEGKYYKVGPEIMLVMSKAVNTLTVERNIQTIPCRPSSASSFMGGVHGFREVIFSQPGISPTSDGEDYQIDANRLKAGIAYISSAIGDMLGDVIRNRGQSHQQGPIVDLLGSRAASFFASPWGQGGNVTDFCYAASSRSTTLKAAVASAVATSIEVASLETLGAVVGDFIQVSSTTPATPGVGEYMRVTSINQNTLTLTVIRNVAPNCLPQQYFAGTAWNIAATRYIFLLTPVYDTVQMVDSVSKFAKQIAGESPDVNIFSRSSGSCSVVGPNIAQVNSLIPITLTANQISYDGMTLWAPHSQFVVGGFINVASEFMLVTSVFKASDSSGVVEVVRDVTPPCLTSTAAAHPDNSDIRQVVSGGCYVMPSATDRNVVAAMWPFATSLIVDANTDMTVGGYLFHDGTTGHTASMGEYMLITDIDGTSITVVRNVAPPCVVGSSILTSTATTQAIAPGSNNLFVLSLSASNNMISTSMRAIVELSPREPISWVLSEPPPPVPAAMTTHSAPATATTPSAQAAQTTPSTTASPTTPSPPAETRPSAGNLQTSASPFPTTPAPSPPAAPANSKFVVTMVVTLPYSKQEFDTTMQEKFKSGIAKVVGAAPSDVTIQITVFCLCLCLFLYACVVHIFVCLCLKECVCVLSRTRADTNMLMYGAGAASPYGHHPRSCDY